MLANINEAVILANMIDPAMLQTIIGAGMITNITVEQC